MEIAMLVLGIIEQLVPLYTKAKADAAQSGENTPEQEAALEAREQALFGQPWWKPESK